MQGVILAAGRGTRLRPVTDDRSKAMVPVLGRPLVDLVAETLVVNGIRELILVVGPEDDEIRRHFTSETTLEVAVRFVVQEHRLGMAHALRQAAPWLDGPFVLSACDSLKPVEHVAALVAAARRADGVLSLMDVAWDRVSLAAAVMMDGEFVRRIVEKPRPGEAPSNTVSLPLYLLPEQALAVLEGQTPSPRGEYEIQDVVQTLIDQGAAIVGIRTDSRRQVSSPEDLLDFNLDVLGGGSGGRLSEALPADVAVRSPVWIDDGVRVGRDCRLGPGAIIERGVILGDGVEIVRSMVLRGAMVPAGTRLEDEVVVGPGGSTNE